MKETEIQRIAREAREFRESEAKRIAMEKEETRKAKEIQKQLELARIALESSKFLKDASEEQRALSIIRDLEKQLLRQDELRQLASSGGGDGIGGSGGGVSEKAHLLSEREEMERRRMEGELAEGEKRKKEKSYAYKRMSSNDDGSAATNGEGGGQPPTTTTNEDSSKEEISPDGMTRGDFDESRNHFERLLNTNSQSVKGDNSRTTIYYDANTSERSGMESMTNSAMDMSWRIPLTGGDGGTTNGRNHVIGGTSPVPPSMNRGGGGGGGGGGNIPGGSDSAGRGVGSMLLGNDVSTKSIYFDAQDSISILEATTNMAPQNSKSSLLTVKDDEKPPTPTLLSPGAIEDVTPSAIEDVKAEEEKPPNLTILSPGVIEGVKVEEKPPRPILLSQGAVVVEVDEKPPSLTILSSGPIDVKADVDPGRDEKAVKADVDFPGATGTAIDVEFVDEKNPALVMLLAGEDDYVGDRPDTNTPGEPSESLIQRRAQATSRNVLGARRTPESEENILGHHSTQTACFEIPIEYNSSDGKFSIGRAAEVSLCTTMAPSRVDGRVSGFIEGKATVGSSPTGLGEAVGSVTFDYAMNQWSKLSMGMIRGHELFHPLITLGGSVMKHGSTLGITIYHNASFLHSMVLEHAMYSISFRHAFTKSRWVASSELSRRQELSLTVSNPKIASTISLPLRRLQNTSAMLELRPTVSEDRFVHVIGKYRLDGTWQIGASLVQSLHSSMATVGLGIRLVSTRGLEWILSWTRGQATVRIPVILSSTLSYSHVGHALYFSMVSFLIQEGIAEIWGWKHPTTTSRQQSATNARSATSGQLPTVGTVIKSQHDAKVQQDLMMRQAKKKLREETEKDGLIIHQAMYAIVVKGGRTKTTWNVTIPLQFWVNHSSLTLPSTSKSQLLGFYDISYSSPDEGSEKEEEQTKEVPTRPTPLLTMEWWKNLVNELVFCPIETQDGPNITSSLGPTIPTLEVIYDYQGRRYELTIQDDEELILPNPMAKSI